MKLTKEWRREVFNQLNKDYNEYPEELLRTFIRYELLKQIYKGEAKVRELTPKEISVMDNELEKMLERVHNANT